MSVSPGKHKNKSIWYYDIKSQPPTEEYRNGWERIYGKKKKKPQKDSEE